MIKCNFAFIMLVNIFGISSSYLIGEFEGEFKDHLSIHIKIQFMPISNKYLLHAIDRNENKLSIKTGKSFAIDSKLIIRFNGLTSIRSAGQSFRPLEEAFYLFISLEFRSNNLYSNNRWSTNELILSNIFDSNSSGNSTIENDWPAVGDLSNLGNRMRIWVAYDHKSTSKSHYYWSTNHIFGCLHLVDFNNKVIRFVKHGNDFYLDCSTRLPESICEQAQCTNKTDIQHVLQCSLSQLSTETHCYSDVYDNIDRLHSYKPTNDGAVVIKLSLVPELSLNQCLMQVITRNDSIIDIYSNPTNQIVMKINHYKSMKVSKYNLYKISSIGIHVLLMIFVDHKLIIRVSDGSFIQTQILSNQNLVKIINIGWNSNTNLCQPIRNKFSIQHNSSLQSIIKDPELVKVYESCFARHNQSNSQKCPNVPQINANQFWNPILLSSIMINIAFVLILLLIIRKRIIDQQSHKFARLISNVYEEQHQAHNVIDLTSFVDHISESCEHVFEVPHEITNIIHPTSAPPDSNVTDLYDYDE